MKKRVLKLLVHFTALCLACAGVLIMSPVSDNTFDSLENNVSNQESQMDSIENTNKELSVSPMHDKKDLSENRE